MKKGVFIATATLLALFAFGSDTIFAQPPKTITADTLMARFLAAVQTADPKAVELFIKTNYEDGFKNNIPLQVHENIINKLHKDFAHYVVASTEKAAGSITTVIRSPFNKAKKITIKTSTQQPGKIAFIDIKDN